MFERFLFHLSLAGSLVLSAAHVCPPAEAQARASAPKLDLAFCIDTTGSMQAELDVVKTKLKSLVAKLGGQKPAPTIRVALIAFRDRGDEYVTRVFPFTDDVDKAVKDIAALQAGGGGDGPEAVNQALHASINDLHWEPSHKATKLLFLIGDAPPHHYDGDYKWKEECSRAAASGIQINTIGCDGLESYGGEGTSVFQEIARLTDGKYESLAYRQEVVGTDGTRETLISSGGATYKVKGAGKASWKDGVTALTAKGMLEKSAAIAPASVVGAAAPMALPMGSFGGISGGKTGALGFSARRASADSDTGLAMSRSGRQDSNLDSVLLEGATEALKKRAH